MRTETMCSAKGFYKTKDSRTLVWGSFSIYDGLPGLFAIYSVQHSTERTTIAPA